MKDGCIEQDRRQAEGCENESPRHLSQITFLILLLAAESSERRRAQTLKKIPGNTIIHHAQRGNSEGRPVLLLEGKQTGLSGAPGCCLLSAA